MDLVYGVGGTLLNPKISSLNPSWLLPNWVWVGLGFLPPKLKLTQTTISSFPQNFRVML